MDAGKTGSRFRIPSVKPHQGKNPQDTNPDARRGAPGRSFLSNEWLWTVALLKALLVVSSANIRRRGRDLHTPAWGVFNPFCPSKLTQQDMLFVWMLWLYSFPREHPVYTICTLTVLVCVSHPGNKKKAEVNPYVNFCFFQLTSALTWPWRASFFLHIILTQTQRWCFGYFPLFTLKNCFVIFVLRSIRV